MVSYDGTASNPPAYGLGLMAFLETNHRSYQRRQHEYTCHIPERRHKQDRRILKNPKHTRHYGCKPHLESPQGNRM